MKGKLELDGAIVGHCRELAHQIAVDTLRHIDKFTTVSVERSVVRLYGVDGVDKLDIPLPNVFVNAVKRVHGLQNGAAYWLAAGMCELDASPQQVVDAVAVGELDLRVLPKHDPDHIQHVMNQTTRNALGDLRKKNDLRKPLRASSSGDAPLLYVLTATGNVYENVNHARAVAENGGDIIAVIRSTAQSLLDYVPYGPTTEGFGGTYATQENFRIMRDALDAWSEKMDAICACLAFALDCACLKLL
jgi:beta-lysine 5,6-aminomutase alpha subunit